MKAVIRFVFRWIEPVASVAFFCLIVVLCHWAMWESTHSVWMAVLTIPIFIICTIPVAFAAWLISVGVDRLKKWSEK